MYLTMHFMLLKMLLRKTEVVSIVSDYGAPLSASETRKDAYYAVTHGAIYMPIILFGKASGNKHNIRLETGLPCAKPAIKNRMPALIAVPT